MPDAPAPRFAATWRVAAPDARTAEAIARDIAHEQTVEVPPDCIPAPVAALRVVAEIEAITPVEGAFDITLSFREDATAPRASSTSSTAMSR